MSQPILPNVPEDAEWYTTSEVATMFRVDPKTVARWHKRGKLAEHGVTVVFTPGNHKRYSKADIDRLWNQLNPGHSGTE